MPRGRSYYHKIPKIATVDWRDKRDRDTMTRDGAKRLATAIRSAWKAVGHDITVRVEMLFIAASQHEHRKASYVVRTNLINGLPPAVYNAIINGGTT